MISGLQGQSPALSGALLASTSDLMISAAARVRGAWLACAELHFRRIRWAIGCQVALHRAIMHELRCRRSGAGWCQHLLCGLAVALSEISCLDADRGRALPAGSSARARRLALFPSSQTLNAIRSRIVSLCARRTRSVAAPVAACAQISCKAPSPPQKNSSTTQHRPDERGQRPAGAIEPITSAQSNQSAGRTAWQPPPRQLPPRCRCKLVSMTGCSCPLDNC